jgi:hypothetical protein
MNNEKKGDSLQRKDIPPTGVVPAVKSLAVKKPQSFFAERPLPATEIAPRLLRYQSRRDFLVFGAGALAALVGAGFLLPQDTLSRLGVRRNMDSAGKEWFLNRALRIDDDVAEELYSVNRRVPTYTKSQITPLKNNYNGDYSRSRLYFWMEIDSGWARFWPEHLSRYSKSPDSFLCA